MKCARPNCPNAARPGKNQGFCQKHYGVINRGYFDAGPVREHIRSLRERGYGVREIAGLAGVTQPGLFWILNEKSPRVQASTYCAVMAIPLPPKVVAAGAEVSAVGSQRRIQALVAIGWTQRRIAAEGGFSFHRLSRVLVQDRILAGTAASIAEVFERLQLRPGPDRRSVLRAERRGWAPPLAWDEDSIDDPAASPVDVKHRGVTAVSFVDRFADVVEHCGETHVEAIAARLGIAPESVQRQAERYGLRVAS